MAPPAPAQCGVARCCGSASLHGLSLKCDMKQHHKGWLIRDSLGSVRWAWSTRGSGELTKSRATVLKSDPDEVAADVPDKDAASGPQQQPAPCTPPQSSKCGKEALGFSEVKVRGRLNFGGSNRKSLSQCVVCCAERDRHFRGNLGWLMLETRLFCVSNALFTLIFVYPLKLIRVCVENPFESPKGQLLRWPVTK